MTSFIPAWGARPAGTRRARRSRRRAAGRRRGRGRRPSCPRSEDPAGAGGEAHQLGAPAHDGLLHEDGRLLEFLLPISDYLFSLPGGPMDVGLVNFYTDKDGMVRRFSPTFFDDGTIPNLTFATLLAVRAAGLEPTSETWSLGRWKVPNRVHPYPIGFVGPPGTIPRLSFSRLLNPPPESDLEIQRLKDKVVIIAAEHVGHQDIHLTLYAHGFLGFGGRMMSGAELHANIVETLFSGRFPQSVPNALRLIYLAGVLIIGTAVFFRRHRPPPAQAEAHPWKRRHPPSDRCRSYP